MTEVIMQLPSTMEHSAPVLINTLVDHLNAAIRLDKSRQAIDKHMDTILVHTFNGLTNSKIEECIDYLSTIDFRKLTKCAYGKLLFYVPPNNKHYRRIRGSMLFELCRHISYTKAIKEISNGQ